MIRFSLVGPLRSGSSLLSRCIDDHDEVICLCESEVHRALFGRLVVRLHFQRMRRHGLHPLEIVSLLDHKRQHSCGDYEAWHNDVLPLLQQKYEKEAVVALGDKSPDFFRTPDLAGHLMETQQLIYTIRDPRAIYRSIQADKTGDDEKDRRWQAFIGNFRFWKDELTRGNLLTVRYEDVVAEPERTLGRVFSHLGVDYSDAFQRSFPRYFPERFLWGGAIEDANEGVRFAKEKSERWREDLPESEVKELQEIPEVKEVMQKFDYPLL